MLTNVLIAVACALVWGWCVIKIAEAWLKKELANALREEVAYGVNRCVPGSHERVNPR